MVFQEWKIENSKEERIDYNDIFWLVVKHVSIRLILSLVVNFDFELEQMDMKTAFLHEDLEERILMKHPEGFVKKEMRTRFVF